ncbi:MAG: 23S rRNA (pseudouridine(1915)-N(3))-methyltransferase RlmH [Clostridia bacterium]|nr:23S rRNA (pseudouridine(1915)-N(3))-methyltransferase RlmH [Clostridia bacterium]
MQSITIICVGKLKEAYWKQACEEYCKRLGSHQVTIVEIGEERLPENPSQAQIEAGLKAEAKHILEKIPQGSIVVPLCIEGKQVSSVELAKKMNTWAVNGSSKVSFIIGSSFGLDDSVKQKGDFCLSMSPMTFPHQLARIMVLEQLYRVSQIEKGGKYHK